MNSIRKFEDLIAWQKAHALTLAVYKLTNSFPSEERYGIISQIRRSCASIPANIAEGFTRLGQADKIRFYNIAESSSEETRYHLLLSNDLGYADTHSLQSECSEVKRIIGGLIKSIKPTAS
ncbi:MAG: four helix bundle protein [Akkermansiaceae bacterium]